MVGIHLPGGLAGWSAVAVGVLLLAAHARGIDAPRAWIERIERRFAYPMRLRFVGGILAALAACGWWATRHEIGTLASFLKPTLLLIGLAGIAMLIAQNFARHLVIAVAEQNDIIVRILAGLVALAGLALVLLPFLS